MIQPHAHVRLDFTGTCSIGPGKIGLLEGIGRTGSLSAAVRSLGMSYRRAWLLLHSTNTAFQEPVVELSVGGKDGGGTRLTPFGARLVADYRRFEAEVDQLAARTFADVRPGGGDPAAVTTPVRPVSRRGGAKQGGRGA